MPAAEVVFLLPFRLAEAEVKVDDIIGIYRFNNNATHQHGLRNSFGSFLASSRATLPNRRRGGIIFSHRNTLTFHEQKAK
jgi:hypothetical protein